MKILILVVSLLSSPAWSKNCCAKTDPHPEHHHLLYYLKHANFKLSPFRGPNCEMNYPPNLKFLEFAQ